MTITEFRDWPDNRGIMLGILSNPTFIQAVTIHRDLRSLTERQVEAANLDASPNVSIRLHNQRIGFEEFLHFLETLTFPNPEKPEEAPPDFGYPEELAKLNEHA